MLVDFSVVDTLRSYRPLIVPGCDVITNVPGPAEDRYRNTTRFFSSATSPTLPSLSRDHADDDVTESRGDPGETPTTTGNDVTGSDITMLKLVLVGLDVIVLLYRVTRVGRVISRMGKCRSRDYRKYYLDEGDGCEDGCASTERRDASGRDHADEGLYSGSIGLSVLAQLMTLVTNRQTDGPRYNGNRRPHHSTTSTKDSTSCLHRHHHRRRRCSPTPASRVASCGQRTSAGWSCSRRW